jgi:hypothetical protein
MEGREMSGLATSSKDSGRAEEKTPLEKRKVVLRKLDGSVLKGFLAEIPIWNGREYISIQSLTNDEIRIPKSEVKALFFVRRFGGNKEHSEVRFFDTHPRIDGLWLRVTFKDNEVVEGIVANHFDFFVEEGFYIKPPDPNTNNRLVYVLKNALKDLTILGIQYSKKNLAEFYDEFQNSRTIAAKASK